MVYIGEMNKLSGSVAKLPAEVVTPTGESLFITHHMVQHNEKNCLVFNCSSQISGRDLKKSLLLGLTLGPSLLGVLLWFQEHAVTQ